MDGYCLKYETAWKCPKCGKSHGWNDQQLVWIRTPYDAFGTKMEVKNREYVDIIDVIDVVYYCRNCGGRVPCPWAEVSEDDGTWG